MGRVAQGLEEMRMWQGLLGLQILEGVVEEEVVYPVKQGLAAMVDLELLSSHTMHKRATSE
jgi:hypothetical protein